MFCPNCGNRIPNESKFCLNCGYRIETSVNLSQHPINTIQSKKISLYGQEITFSEEEIKQIGIISELTNEVDIFVSRAFEFLLKEDFSSTLNVVKRIAEESKKSIDNYCTLVGTKLEEYGLNEFKVRSEFDWDESRIGLDLIKYCNKVESGIANAKIEKNIAAGYNELEKLNRTRFIGGGFGIKGAVKGIATASVLNGISGAAYSLRNAVRNNKLNSIYNEQVRTIPNASFKKMDFQESLRATMDSILDAAIDTISENNPFFCFNTNKREEYVYYYNKIYDLSPKEFDKIPKIAVKMFSLDPLDIDGYTLVIDRIGDPNHELLELARSMGLNEDELIIASESFNYSEKLFGEIRTDVLSAAEGASNLSGLAFSYHGMLLCHNIEPFAKYETNSFVKRYPDDFVRSFFRNLCYEANAAENKPVCFTDFNTDRTPMIKWNMQLPLLLIKNGTIDSWVEKGKYVLITNENMYIGDQRFPLMNIYHIHTNDENSEVFINGDFSHTIKIGDNIALYSVICTAVFFLQLLHEIDQTDKIIPLLERCNKYPAERVKNIYFHSNLGIIDSNYDIDINYLRTLPNTNYYFRGYSDTEKELKFNQIFQIKAEREDIIAAYFDDNANQGIATTARRLIIISNAPREIEYNTIISLIEDMKNSEIALNPIENCIADISLAGFSKNLFKRIVSDIILIQSEYNDNEIIYDTIDKDSLVILENGKNPIAILRHVLCILLESNESLRDECNPNGFDKTEEFITKIKNFDLEATETVYICCSSQLIQGRHPIKKGYLFTSFGIRVFNKNELIKVSWVDFLWDDYSEEEVSLLNYKINGINFGWIREEYRKILYVINKASKGYSWTKAMIAPVEPKLRQLPTENSTEVQDDITSSSSIAVSCSMSDTIYCSFCGKKVLRKIKFCNYCGKQNVYNK